jgi:hypothetical protein
MACDDRSCRYVNDVKVDARALSGRRDPNDLSFLGDFTIEHLVVRHDD